MNLSKENMIQAEILLDSISFFIQQSEDASGDTPWYKAVVYVGNYELWLEATEISPKIVDPERAHYWTKGYPWHIGYDKLIEYSQISLWAIDKCGDQEIDLTTDPIFTGQSFLTAAHENNIRFDNVNAKEILNFLACLCKLRGGRILQ